MRFTIASAAFWLKFFGTPYVRGELEECLTRQGQTQARIALSDVSAKTLAFAPPDSSPVVPVRLGNAALAPRCERTLHLHFLHIRLHTFIYNYQNGIPLTTPIATSIPTTPPHAGGEHGVGGWGMDIVIGVVNVMPFW